MIDHNATPGNQLVPKISNELAAGIHSTDVAVLGTTTAPTGFLPIDGLEPAPPFLIGPNSRDLSKWHDNKIHYSDNAEQYNPIFSLYVFTPVTFNTNMMTGNEFTSFYDLLDPQWKGKMALLDPTIAGGGNSLFSFRTSRPDERGVYYSEQRPTLTC